MPESDRPRARAHAAAPAGPGRWLDFTANEWLAPVVAVITLFLLPDLNLKLRPTILGLKPGTRIVSNSFNMGEWEAGAKGAFEDVKRKWGTEVNDLNELLLDIKKAVEQSKEAYLAGELRNKNSWS